MKHSKDMSDDEINNAVQDMALHINVMVKEMIKKHELCELCFYGLLIDMAAAAGDAIANERQADDNAIRH